MSLLAWFAIGGYIAAWFCMTVYSLAWMRGRDKYGYLGEQAVAALGFGLLWPLSLMAFVAIHLTEPLREDSGAESGAHR